jgi:hypothetical protein
MRPSMQAGVVALMAVASNAMADIALVARTSRTTNVYYWSFGGQPGNGTWNDAATTNDWGQVTLSTPHGDPFTSTADANGIAANMSGASQSSLTAQGTTQIFNSTSRSNSIVVDFGITGSAMPYHLNFSGTTNDLGNARLTIVNLGTGVTIFSAATTTPPALQGGVYNWGGVSWDSVLQPGNYRFSSDASGANQTAIVGGVVYGGNGTMNFELSFIPAPGVSSFAGAMLLTLSRRPKRPVE